MAGLASGSSGDERVLFIDPVRNYTCARCRQRRAYKWKHYADGTKAPWCKKCTSGGSGPPPLPKSVPKRYANRHRRWAWRSAWPVYERALREARKPRSDLSSEESLSSQALNRIIRHRDPKPEAWRAILKYLTLSIDELYTPLHYLPECSWTKRDKRVLDAVGLGGALVQFLHTREGGHFLRAIQDADKQGEFPYLPPPMGKQDDPVCVSRYYESCLFRLKGMRLKRCRHGRGHWFVAKDYHHRRYCLAHKLVKGIAARELHALAPFVIDVQDGQAKV